MDHQERAPEAPAAIDLTRPSAARVYDWYLGGRTNYAIDREFGARAVRELPVVRALAASNRRWLGRVVRAALEAGIEQFWDLGSGVPTVGNVHEIVAASGAGDPRVLYVDYEHVAVAHSRRILGEQEVDWADIVQRDLRAPSRIIEDPITRRVLDFQRPICLIMASVLQFVGCGDGIAELMAHYRRRLPPGSWLAISHITTDDAPERAAAQITALAEAYKDTQNPAWLRGREEFTSWLTGLEPVEPGIVHATDWRPDPLPADQAAEEAKVRPLYWSGVGRVPR